MFYRFSWFYICVVTVSPEEKALFSDARIYIIIYLLNGESLWYIPRPSRSFANFCLSVFICIFLLFIYFFLFICYFFKKLRTFLEFIYIPFYTNLPNMIVPYSLLILRWAYVPIAFLPLILMKWLSSCSRRIAHTLVQRELILTTANFRNCPVKRQATLFTTSPVNLYDNHAAFVDPLDNSNEFLDREIVRL